MLQFFPALFAEFYLFIYPGSRKFRNIFRMIPDTLQIIDHMKVSCNMLALRNRQHLIDPDKKIRYLAA